jgi:hypothetical protein
MGMEMEMEMVSNGKKCGMEGGVRRRLSGKYRRGGNRRIGEDNERVGRVISYGCLYV